MMTHMGYLPDIGRWLFWAVIGIIIIGIVWLAWVVKKWGRLR